MKKNIKNIYLKKILDASKVLKLIGKPPRKKKSGHVSRKL